MKTPQEDFAYSQGTYGGLTKRELFAAMAMQAVISNQDVWTNDFVARQSIELADALIAELAKEAPQ